MSLHSCLLFPIIHMYNQSLPGNRHHGIDAISIRQSPCVTGPPCQCPCGVSPPSGAASCAAYRSLGAATSTPPPAGRSACAPAGTGPSTSACPGGGITGPDRSYLHTITEYSLARLQTELPRPGRLAMSGLPTAANDMFSASL